MTPEAPGNLVVIDVLESADGFRYQVERWDPAPDAREFLWTLWAAEEECPSGFVPAADGAVCVAAPPSYRHARYRARPRVVRNPRALSWADVAEGVGLMVVAVLPEGWVYDEGNVPPRESKPFAGRMALYWRSGGDDERIVRLAWTLKPLEGSLRDACAALNDPDLPPLLDLAPPVDAVLEDWAGREERVEPDPPRPVVNIQAGTVIFEGGLTVNQVWEQHASTIPLDVLAAQLEQIHRELAGKEGSSQVSDAVDAARAGDGPAALRALRRVGKTVLDVASRVGADVAAAAAKAALGL